MEHWVYGDNETYFKCDQVAEPLMGKLVTDNCGNSLLIGRARLAVVVQQVRLTVRDQAPVLHCSRYKVRDGDHVLLGQGVTDVVVVREEVSDVRADVEGVPHTVLLLGSGVDAELGLMDGGELLLVLKVADDEAGKVSDMGTDLWKVTVVRPLAGDSSSSTSTGMLD